MNHEWVVIIGFLVLELGIIALAMVTGVMYAH